MTDYDRTKGITLSQELETLFEDILDENSTTIPNYERLEPLFLSLKEQEAWDLLAAVSGAALKRGAVSSSTVALHLQALRGSERHEDALDTIYALPKELLDSEVLTQWGAILCEGGEFAGVLELLEPSSGTTMGSYSDDLLNLMGWAHQNSLGDEHGVKGAEIYQLALQKMATVVADEDQRADSRHPAAYEGAAEYRRNLRKIKVLWYRKGYGDSLRRLPRTRDQAEAQWRRVLLESEPDLRLNCTDPLVLRIAGWCYYCLGEYEQSIAAYRQAIDARIAIYRPQFDYALVLCAKGSASTALQQYRRALVDARRLGPLRRAGLIRVALFELHQAMMASDMLRSRSQTGEIWGELMDDFSNVCSEIRPLGTVKERLTSAAAELSDAFGHRAEIEVVPAMGVIDWSSSQIVGIKSPDPEVCGLFMPVVKFNKSNGRRFAVDLIPSLTPDKPARITVSECSPGVSVKEILTSVSATPMTRVVYLSTEALRVLRLLRLELPVLTHGTWIRSVDSEDELLACTGADEGAIALDQMAASGIKTLIRALANSATSTDALYAELAKLCFFAAQRAETIYLSALCFALLHPEHPDLQFLRKDMAQNVLPEPDALLTFANRFHNLIRLMPSNEPDRWDNYKLPQLADLILTRAAEISLIKNLSDRIHEALWAAAEIQAIAPEDTRLREVEEQTARRLSVVTSLYLTDNLELFALAGDPAFYCSVTASSMSKPALDVISFFKVSDTLSKNHLREGRIALKARSLDT